MGARVARAGRGHHIVAKGERGAGAVILSVGMAHGDEGDGTGSARGVSDVASPTGGRSGRPSAGQRMTAEYGRAQDLWGKQALPERISVDVAIHPDVSSPDPLPSEVASPKDEFLYHLHRGTDLLAHDRVAEAKDELERALTYQPQDAHGQDLLAGIYFRLGFYPEAIALWRQLVGAYASNAELRVNLSLVLLKSGDVDGALEQVEAALRVQPDHSRAWGYGALCYWRLGRLGDARYAFERGGQVQMARRMDGLLGDSWDKARNPSAMRAAAEEAIRAFEAEQLPLTVEQDGPDRGQGAWRVDEPGQEVTPAGSRPPSKRPSGGAWTRPASLKRSVTQWLAQPEAETEFSLLPRGRLRVASEAGLFARQGQVVAVRGEPTLTPVPRRRGGVDQSEPLGASCPVFHWSGAFLCLLDPAEGAGFEVIDLRDEVVFIREPFVFGFSERVSFDCAPLLPVAEDSAEESPEVVQLHGSGQVVLSVQGPVSAVEVTPGAAVTVQHRALLGWTGRVLPSRAQMPIASSGSSTRTQAAEDPHAVRFIGDGTLLLI